MLSRTEIINFISKKLNAKTYLEIGVRNPKFNFNKINVYNKTGVDIEPIQHPKVKHMSANDFFIQNDNKFDVIFVDGDHHYEPAKQDMENALNSLRPNGIVICHDCNPWHKSITGSKKTGAWCGDVYKSFIHTVNQGNILYATINSDCGVGLMKIKKDIPKVTLPNITWDYFNQNRKRLLNLINPKQFRKELISLGFFNETNKYM